MASFGLAPITRAFSSPSLKRMRVGMLITPYLRDISGLSSTFSLATLRTSDWSCPISSTIGETMWHGTHQSAQKSTRTGRSAFRTSLSKFSSVASTMSVMRPVLLSPPSAGNLRPKARFHHANREVCFPIPFPAAARSTCLLPVPEIGEELGGDPVEHGSPPRQTSVDQSAIHLGRLGHGFPVQRTDQGEGVLPPAGTLDAEVQMRRELVLATRRAVAGVPHQAEHVTRLHPGTGHDPGSDLRQVRVEVVLAVRAADT